MNRKERRNLQRQGVQVPKDPTLNIKLSALGKSIMTPEMQMAMMHEINQQCLEKDDLLALDVDCMVLWTLHRHLGFGVKRLHDFYLAMAAEHRRMRDFYEMDDLYPERLKLKELSKNLRGQDNAAHIAEEIADVEIMLEQLKLMFSIRDEVTQQRTVKLQRLDNRISQSLIHPKP